MPAKRAAAPCMRPAAARSPELRRRDGWCDNGCGVESRCGDSLSAAAPACASIWASWARQEPGAPRERECARAPPDSRARRNRRDAGRCRRRDRQAHVFRARDLVVARLAHRWLNCCVGAYSPWRTLRALPASAISQSKLARRPRSPAPARNGVFAARRTASRKSFAVNPAASHCAHLARRSAVRCAPAAKPRARLRKSPPTPPAQSPRVKLAAPGCRVLDALAFGVAGAQ